MASFSPRALIVALQSALRRHKGSLAGLLTLMIVASAALATILSLQANANAYERHELQRLGYGDITVWASNLPSGDPTPVTDALEALNEIERVGVQTLVYSDYEVNGEHSDSEGQLIVYDPDHYDYRLLNDAVNGYESGPRNLKTGQVLVSPAMRSMFDVRIGDTIAFQIVRGGAAEEFTVAGYIEDPFMGSSMIGMKGFLISASDMQRISERIEHAGIDALGRTGAMLHISANPAAGLDASALNTRINEVDGLRQVVQSVHTVDAIAGFTLTALNAYVGMLLAFVVVLIAVAGVVLGASINADIEQDAHVLGIYKALGCTTGMLRILLIIQHMLGIVLGVIVGAMVSLWTVRLATRTTVDSTGLLVPSTFPIGRYLACAGVIIVTFAAFILVKTRRLACITPLHAIQGSMMSDAFAGPASSQSQSKRLGSTSRRPSLRAHALGWSMAVRQLHDGRRWYAGACMVVALIVLLSSMVVRVDAWLGSDGRGLMDAFNPADMDIGVQCIGDCTVDQARAIIESHTGVSDEYELAMPGVALNGTDMTANVITEPERFHILEGTTSQAADQAVITEFVSRDLGVGLGDTVTLSSDQGSAQYTVVGIYQCANDMGLNVGLSAEGYARIGRDNPQMWCHHFFLTDEGTKQEVLRSLQDTFGGNAYVHENAWPGLYGIVAAMRMLVVAMIAVVTLVMFVAVALSGSKILIRERHDLVVCRLIGLSARRLRASFSIRFALVAALGAAIGTVVAVFATDPLTGSLLRLYGVSDFASHPAWWRVPLPGLLAVALAAVFAYLVSGSIRRVGLPRELAGDE
ncbi:FtsX-like permease family protein [Bifidobacterium oedipodis]|uniref:Efflux ABC transporter permease protein n=1 Tax=Bifidobacterium oedipodis TaxID=2675322 RepID=A0A7Y0EQ78_9BIFI|nr:FtsX-like permease family protein [Bifidobacterium sp. DSM 109957]NMM94415.1 efflux ABC transporter permease protein [Bifidobacterium sp. DSM 109957]